MRYDMTDTGEFAFAPRGFGFGVDIVDGKREGGVFIMFWKRRGEEVAEMGRGCV
jgi:hypothetical protein